MAEKTWLPKRQRFDQNRTHSIFSSNQERVDPPVGARRILFLVLSVGCFWIAKALSFLPNQIPGSLWYVPLAVLVASIASTYLLLRGVHGQRWTQSLLFLAAATCLQLALLIPDAIQSLQHAKVELPQVFTGLVLLLATGLITLHRVPALSIFRRWPPRSRTVFVYPLLLLGDAGLLLTVPALFPVGFPIPVPLPPNQAELRSLGSATSLTPSGGGEKFSKEALIVIDPQITADLVSGASPKIKPTAYPVASELLAAEIESAVGGAPLDHVRIAFSETSFLFSHSSQVHAFFEEFQRQLNHHKRVTMLVGSLVGERNLVILSRRDQAATPQTFLLRKKEELMPILERSFLGIGQEKVQTQILTDMPQWTGILQIASSIIICYEGLFLDHWQGETILILSNHNAFGSSKWISQALTISMRSIAAILDRELILVTNAGISGTFARTVSIPTLVIKSRAIPNVLRSQNRESQESILRRKQND